MIEIYNEDCLVGMKDIKDKSIDMILCDLPYGVTRNRWDSVLPPDKLWKEYERIIKDNGAVVLFGQGGFTTTLINSNRSLFRYTLVWDKVLSSGFLNANRMPLRCHEDIIIFYKKLPTYNPQMSTGSPSHTKGSSVGSKNSDILKNNNYGDYIVKEATGNAKYPTSILRYPKPHPSIGVHPTQKPAELCEYLIKTYTNEGDTVLDNCMGSGTTGVACVNTNRNFIGFELEKQYFDIAKERIYMVDLDEIREEVRL